MFQVSRTKDNDKIQKVRNLNNKASEMEMGALRLDNCMHSMCIRYTSMKCSMRFVYLKMYANSKQYAHYCADLTCFEQKTSPFPTILTFAQFLLLLCRECSDVDFLISLKLKLQK